MSDIHAPLADYRPYGGWVGKLQAWSQASRTTIRLVLVMAAAQLSAMTLIVGLLIVGSTVWQTNTIIDAYAVSRDAARRGRTHTDCLLERNYEALSSPAHVATRQCPAMGR